MFPGKKRTCRALWFVCLAGWLGQSACTQTVGPQIEPDVNVRNLCNYGINGEMEDRCKADSDCENPFFCKLFPQISETGRCRSCQTDTNCPAGKKCDVGWCHKSCSASAECAKGEFCTKGFCRKPYMQSAQFTFCNVGDEVLEVNIGETKLYGQQDACVFSRFQWEPGDQPIVSLVPKDCNLFLSIKFTPPTAGVFRGFLQIVSNSKKNNPLPLLLCANAIEADCVNEMDKSCPACASCTYDNFAELIEQEPVPDCATYN